MRSYVKIFILLAKDVDLVATVELRGGKRRRWSCVELLKDIVRVER